MTALSVIEAASLAIALFVALRCARDGSWPALAALVVAGWLGEEASMALYGYYGYSDRWLLVLHRTPLAVALVWPLVVLSSIEVVRRVVPWRRRAAWPHGRAALVVGALVVYDALVLEPVATRLGLWWWRGGSYFGVPALGLLGWGIFGACASYVLSRCGAERSPPRALLAAPLAALATQAILAPLVCGALRLGLRVPLSESAWAVGVGGLGLALCPLAHRLRPLVEIRFADLDVKVAGSALFFASVYALRLWPFALYCSTVPLPYLFLTLGRPDARA
jgi:hypothetical protein